MSSNERGSAATKLLALIVIIGAIGAAAFFFFFFEEDDPVAPTSPTNAAPAEPSGSAPPAGSATFDIRVTNLRTDPPAAISGGPAVLNQGSQYGFIVEVTNSGPDNVPGNVAAAFEWSCSADAVGARAGNDIAFIGSLAAGETKESSPAMVTMLNGPGSCTVRFRADPDNIYAETDESDQSNVWETTLAVQ